MADETTYGQTGFEAYRAAGPQPAETYDGKPLPTWGELTEPAAPVTRARWEAASLAVIDRYLAEHGLPARNAAADAADRKQPLTRPTVRAALRGVLADAAENARAGSSVWHGLGASLQKRFAALGIDPTVG